MSDIIVDPAWDLAKINTFIAQQENVLQGPLTKIGKKDGKMSLHISDLDGKPTKHAVLTTGKPPLGATIIGAVTVSVAGAEAEIIAYRLP